METEIGNALISLLIGVVLTKIPNEQILNNTHVQNIADELQADGFAIAGEQIFDTIFAGMIPELLPILQGKSATKKIKKTRVKVEKIVDYIIEEQESTEIKQQQKVI